MFVRSTMVAAILLGDEVHEAAYGRLKYQLALLADTHKQGESWQGLNMSRTLKLTTHAASIAQTITQMPTSQVNR